MGRCLEICLMTLKAEGLSCGCIMAGEPVNSIYTLDDGWRGGKEGSSFGVTDHGCGLIGFTLKLPNSS